MGSQLAPASAAYGITPRRRLIFNGVAVIPPHFASQAAKNSPRFSIPKMFSISLSLHFIRFLTPDFSFWAKTPLFIIIFFVNINVKLHK